MYLYNDTYANKSNFDTETVMRTKVLSHYYYIVFIFENILQWLIFSSIYLILFVNLVQLNQGKKR